MISLDYLSENYHERTKQKLERVIKNNTIKCRCYSTLSFSRPLLNNLTL
jgi:hypothetical protein